MGLSEMRVLFWTYPTAFQAPGGGETILLKTREYLEKLGVQVDLFDQWSTKLRDYPLVHCFHSGHPEFWEAVKETAARLVVTPTHWPTTDAKIRLWRWLKRRGRVLAAVRGPYKDIGYYYSLADALLPSSQTEVELLAHYCGVPRDKMTVVRNGAEPRFVGADPQLFVERYGLRDFVVCVARIMPRKNQLRIVRALKGWDVPVVLIGVPDPDAREYFEQCQKEAGQNVHFRGWLDHESALLPSALAAARVFLMPSEVDIAPVAVVEAAAAGCRLVVTPVGSAPEYYGESACYVDPTSEADIRAKTITAFERGRMTDAERRGCVQTWADVAQQVLDVYRRIG
jgi:glycosyltransferase involved in cell wall biosynthesis